MKTLGLFLSFVKGYSLCDGKFSLTTAGWHRAPAEAISIHPDAETEKWKYLDERKEAGRRRRTGERQHAISGGGEEQKGHKWREGENGTGRVEAGRSVRHWPTIEKVWKEKTNTKNRRMQKKS